MREDVQLALLVLLALAEVDDEVDAVAERVRERELEGEAGRVALPERDLLPELLALAPRVTEADAVAEGLDEALAEALAEEVFDVERVVVLLGDAQDLPSGMRKFSSST